MRGQEHIDIFHVSVKDHSLSCSVQYGYKTATVWLMCRTAGYQSFR